MNPGGDHSGPAIGVTGRPPPDQDQEDRDQRDDESVDEQFRSLLEGLRTTIPGAQVLVAFLLVLPAQASFSEFTTAERVSYYVALAMAMVASILLIAPSVHQRMRHPISGMARRDRHHVVVAVHLTIVGTVAMLVALVAAAYLATSLVYETELAMLAALALAAVGGFTWFYQPLVSFQRR